MKNTKQITEANKQTQGPNAVDPREGGKFKSSRKIKDKK